MAHCGSGEMSVEAGMAVLGAVSVVGVGEGRSSLYPCHPFVGRGGCGMVLEGCEW